MSVRCSAPRCPGWPLQPEDRYCGWCGTALRTLAARVELLRQQKWVPLAQPVVGAELAGGHLRIQANRPCETLRAPAWMHWQRGPDGRSFVLADWSPPPAPQSLELCLEGEEGQLRLPLHVGSRPLWQAPVQPLQWILPESDEGLPRWTVPVILQQGVVVVDAPPRLTGGEGLRLEWEHPLPFRLSAGTPLNLHVSAAAGQVAGWRRSLLQTTPAGLRELQLELTFHWQGSEQTVLRYPVQLLLPAELRFALAGQAGLHFEWPLIEGLDARTLRLQLSNGAPGESQRAPVRLDSVSLHPAQGPVRISGSPPPVLQGGESCELSLERIPGVPLASEAVVVEVEHSCGKRQSCYVHLENKLPEPYPGWLSLDLGHSNLCVGILDARGGGSVMEWQTGPRRWAPAALLYTRALPQRVCLTGELARAGSLEPGAENAVVLSPKHAFQVGQQKIVYPSQQPEQKLQLSGQQLLEDQLCLVLEQAQRCLYESNGSACFPTRLLLCHPARLPASRLPELEQAARAALERLGLARLAKARPEILLVCEPVAAALRFLADPAHLESLVSGAGRTVALLVVDCGGQTVDLTVVEVGVRQAGAQWLLRPRVVGVDGFPHSGGAWVTEQLAGLLLQRSGLRLQQLTRREQHRVLEFGERLKIALNTREPLDPFLAEWHELALACGLATAAADLPCLLDLEAACRPQIQRMVEVAHSLLQRSVGSGADGLLLVGQGARLGVLVEAFRAGFSSATLFQPEESKECCALGCGYHPLVAQERGLLLDSGPAATVHLQLDTDSMPLFTTSRWGVPVETPQGARFLEVIPAGLRMPAGGLERPLRNCLLRPGVNRIRLLENIGHEDHIEGNSEIQPGGEALLEVPEALFGRPTELRLRLQPDWTPVLELWCEQQKIAAVSVR